MNFQGEKNLRQVNPLDHLCRWTFEQFSSQPLGGMVPEGAPFENAASFALSCFILKIPKKGAKWQYVGIHKPTKLKTAVCTEEQVLNVEENGTKKNLYNIITCHNALKQQKFGLWY